MKITAVREDKLYYVRKENIEAFTERNIVYNGLNKMVSHLWLTPKKVKIYNRYDRFIVLNHDGFVLSYKQEDFELVEEYSQYVQEEMEL